MIKKQDGGSKGGPHNIFNLVHHPNNCMFYYRTYFFLYRNLHLMLPLCFSQYKYLKPNKELTYHTIRVSYSYPSWESLNLLVYLSHRHVFYYSFASLMSFRACMQWKKNLFAASGWRKHHEARGTKGFPKGRSFPNFRFCSNWLALLYLLGFLLHVLCLDDGLNLHFDIDHKA